MKINQNMVNPLVYSKLSTIKNDMESLDYTDYKTKKIIKSILSLKDCVEMLAEKSDKQS